MFKDSIIFIFFKTRLLRGDLNWKLNTGTAHLFFLQDDFLLQHFDSVEFIVCSELGKQDLHEGLFVSGLFGKHSLRHHHCSRDITRKPLWEQRTQHRYVICGNRWYWEIWEVCWYKKKKRCVTTLQPVNTSLTLKYRQRREIIKSLLYSSFETFLCFLVFCCSIDWMMFR